MKSFEPTLRQPPQPIQRRAALRQLAWPLAASAVAASPLAGCASLADLARLHVSLAELVAMLERQFPREQRVAEVIDVALRLPRLQLLPERNRLATTLALTARERILGRQAQGTLALAYGLRFEPQDFSVRLSQVAVEGFQLDGGAQLSSAWQSIGQAVVQRLLEDLTVVKIATNRAEALRKLSLTQAAMTVTAAGLDIRFGAPTKV